MCTIRQTRGDDIDAHVDNWSAKLLTVRVVLSSGKESGSTTRDFTYTRIILRADFEYSEVEDHVMYGVAVALWQVVVRLRKRLKGPGKSSKVRTQLAPNTFVLVTWILQSVPLTKR